MGNPLTTMDMTRRVGRTAVPLSVGELLPHLTQYRWAEAYSIPSGILIHPTVWPQYTKVIVLFSF